MSKPPCLYKKPYLPAELVPSHTELDLFCEKKLHQCLNEGGTYSSCIPLVNSSLMNTYGERTLKNPRRMYFFDREHQR